MSSSETAINLSKYVPDSPVGMRPNSVHRSDQVMVEILKEILAHLASAMLLDADAV